MAQAVSWAVSRPLALPIARPGPVKREGLIKPEMMQDWLNKSNVVLRGGGVDESPHCYKRLPEVLAAYGEMIRVCTR